MLKQYFSSNVNRMVRPFRMRLGQIARCLGVSFFIEGFALYGASLDPSSTFFAEAALAVAHARWARSADGGPPAMTDGQGDLQPPEEGNVVAPEHAARADLRSLRDGDNRIAHSAA